MELSNKKGGKGHEGTSEKEKKERELAREGTGRQIDTERERRSEREDKSDS